MGYINTYSCQRCRRLTVRPGLCGDCYSETPDSLAPDAYITPEERKYLEETFGLAPGSLPDENNLDATAPYCHSCLLHGPNRSEYPCLREPGDCNWRKHQEALLAQAQWQQYGQQFPSMGSQTSTYISTTWQA